VGAAEPSRGGAAVAGAAPIAGWAAEGSAAAGDVWVFIASAIGAFAASP
jgi:hypothetical protein